MAAPDLGFVPDTEAPDLGFVADAVPAAANIPAQQAAAQPPAPEYYLTGKNPNAAAINPALGAQFAKAGVLDRLKMMAAQWAPTDAAVTPQIAKNFAAQGINTVVPAAGATLGGMAGPAGAMAGGGLGTYAAGQINNSLGIGPPATAGQIVGNTIAPGGRGVLTAPLAAMLATSAQSGIDAHTYPTFGQLALSAAGGSLASQGKEAPTSIEATRDAALAAGQAEGLAVDPNTVNNSLLNRAVGGMGGKADLKATASIKNAPIINDLGVRAMGLPAGTPLTPEAIQAAVAKAQQPYNDLRSISPELDTALDDLEDLKYTAANLKFQSETSAAGTSLRGNPALKRQIPNADLAVANKLDQINTMAVAAGKPELADAFSDANVQLAKIGEVDNAFDPNTGVLSASKLAARQRQGVPLSDELKTIADMGANFPDYVRDPSKIAAPGSNKLTPIVAAQAAFEGAKAAGPIGVLAGGLPFMDKYARGLALSPTWQSYMAQPRYGYSDPSMLANMARYATQSAAVPAQQ